MECPEISQFLQRICSDPHVTDLCLNGNGRLWIDRGHGMESLEMPFEDHQLKTWAISQLNQLGKAWDAKFPFMDATLPDGYRLHVVFAGVHAQGTLISLRKLAQHASLQMNSEHSASAKWGDSQMAVERWNSNDGFEILRSAVLRKETLLISGATGSGKTTLLNDLLSSIPHTERVIALEDTPELAPQHPHFLSLNSRPPNADGFGEITLRTLLRQTLRMRPDRVVLGECRGAETLDLLQILNSGHAGSLATLHANSSREALRRVELLCLLHGGGAIPLSAIRELLALGVQWLAHVARAPSRRAIQEIYQVQGREGETLLLRPILKDFFKSNDAKNRGDDH